MCPMQHANTRCHRPHTHNTKHKHAKLWARATHLERGLAPDPRRVCRGAVLRLPASLQVWEEPALEVMVAVRDEGAWQKVARENQRPPGVGVLGRQACCRAGLAAPLGANEQELGQRGLRVLVADQVRRAVRQADHAVDGQPDLVRRGDAALAPLSPGRPTGAAGPRGSAGIPRRLEDAGRLLHSNIGNLLGFWLA